MSTIFNGQEHFATGNATVTGDGNSVTVAGIGNSGADGVTVQTNKVANWDMFLDGIDITQGRVLNVKYVGEDGYGRTKVLQQLAITNPTGIQAEFSVDSRMLSDNFKLVGELNGVKTFETVYNKSQLPPDANWVILALLAAGYIADRIDLSATTKTDANGNVIEETSKVSWNGIASGGGGGNSSFTDFLGQSFDADHVYVESVYDYSAYPRDPNLANDVAFVQLTGKNLPDFNITNYLIS